MVGKSGSLSAVIWLVIVTISYQSSADANRVMCSFSNTASDRTGEYAFGIEDIPVSMCTHVVYNRLGIDLANGRLTSWFTKYDIEKDGLKKFAALKTANPNLKLLLRIESDVLFISVSQESQRHILVENIRKQMEEMSVDGIELHWRSQTSSMHEAMYLFIEDLLTSFKASGHPDWEVIVMVDIDHAINHARLCQFADFVHIVINNERKPFFSESGSLLSEAFIIIDDKMNLTTEAAVQHWIDNDCPASMIILGVDFKGRTYTISDDKEIDAGDECAHTESTGYCGYFELCEMFNEGNWEQEWDSEQAMAPIARQDGQWVAYENAESVGMKGKLARTKELAGVYANAPDLDDYRGKCGTEYPLLKALRKSFTED